MFLTGFELGAALWPSTLTKDDRPPTHQLRGYAVSRVPDLQEWLADRPAIEASFKWPTRVVVVCPQLEVPNARPLDVSLTQRQFDVAMAAANGIAKDLRQVLAELAARAAANPT